MNQSRQALILSLLYSLPLLAWLAAQLKYIEWNSGNLQFLFRQTLLGLILFQTFATILLFINHANNKWHDDAMGVIHILLFPLPFLTLIWLTGSASLNVILKSLLLVGSVGALALLVQQCGRMIPMSMTVIRHGLSLMHILLAVTIWNYHYLWRRWLEL